jgi:membrane-associated phospholipid phosphatase
MLLLCSALCRAQVQNSGCLSETASDISQDAAGLARATGSAPRAAIQPRNLKWELPIAAATAVLITSVDGHTIGLVKSPSVVSNSSKASNAALGAQVALAAVPFVVGCAGGREHARRAGFAALEGMGYALGTDLLLKAAFNRQYVTSRNSEGDFWEGGKSFPSGHASAMWGLASALAHQYPHNRPLKWAAYSLATTATLLRIPARKHFPSDILVGATLGYLIGSEIGSR